MSTKSYARHASTRVTPQTEAIPGSSQVENSSGGFSFAVDDWARLDRFLVLGSEKGSYYATEQSLTRENAAVVRRCAEVDPRRTVDRIVEISVSGRAPKNDPAIFAIAMLSGMGGDAARYALEAMPAVCRTGTHLFQFVEAAEQFRGWGRAMKRAVGGWYLDKSPEKLCYQLAKYQQRNGWSHRDVLRLAKPVTDNDPALAWAVGKSTYPLGDMAGEKGYSLLVAFEQAKRATTAAEIVTLINEYNLPRECIPTKWLNEQSVWHALLGNMPMTAMVRNLGKMSAIGLTTPMSAASEVVASRLVDEQRLRDSRIHPLQVLMALAIYQNGRGLKGSLSWSPDANILSALDKAFNLSFGNVVPTGKRHLMALDVSGSMSTPISGTFLSCREAAAAMAMVTVKTEPLTHTVAFTGGCGFRGWNETVLTEMAFHQGMSIRDAVGATERLNFGQTDCALPMVYALDKKIEADVFVVLTDSETYAGSIHPVQALKKYRRVMGIPAKLVVVGMVSNEFSIADPDDAGMLDVVGFDSAAPSVIADFVR